MGVLLLLSIRGDLSPYRRGGLGCAGAVAGSADHRFPLRSPVYVVGPPRYPADAGRRGPACPGLGSYGDEPCAFATTPRDLDQLLRLRRFGSPGSAPPPYDDGTSHQCPTGELAYPPSRCGLDQRRSRSEGRGGDREDLELRWHHLEGHDNRNDERHPRCSDTSEGAAAHPVSDIKRLPSEGTSGGGDTSRAISALLRGIGDLRRIYPRGCR